MRNVLLTVVLVLSGACGPLARACATHDTSATLVNWLPTGTSGSMVQGFLSLETSLVAPTSSTTCTAGIGLGTLADPLPAGFNVSGMEIVVMNATTGSHTPLSAFVFEPNSNTASSLAAGSGSSAVPNTNPLFQGSTWWGFAAAVDPFVLPVLGPDEYTAFLFSVEVPESLLPLARDVQFAGGEGQADGTPIFTGDHPAQYFTAANPSVEFVPEPSSAVLALLAAAAVVIARRFREPYSAIATHANAGHGSEESADFKISAD